MLSAGSKGGLVLPSNVVTSVSADSSSSGTASFELSTALLHENGKDEVESVSVAVVSYLDGHLQEVSFANQSLVQ